MHSELPANVCPHCGESLRLSEQRCPKCGTIRRDRVPNIDFWKLFWMMIERPKSAMLNIIQAEKKSFLSILWLFGALKLLINGNYLAIHLGIRDGFCSQLPVLQTGVLLIVCLSLALFFTAISNRIRFRDSLSIISYSLIPLLIGLFVLFIPEFILFGKFIFIREPSPFLFNKALAIFFTVVEGAIVLWSCFLMMIGFGAVLKNTVVVWGTGFVCGVVINLTPLITISLIGRP
jgi:hypothetical protein